MEINVLLDEDFSAELEISWLESVVRKVLTAQAVKDETELGLLITSEERVRELNRDYRGLDEPTDVLAFSATESADLTPFVSPPDGIAHLGEVIISYPQAEMQAKEHKHSLKKELAVLIIHGLLHLLGYDHENPAQERKMQAKEAEILSLIEGGLK